MLERVPAAAESTAQFFLRSVEKPVRSSRVLDARFWRNGADQIDTSSWWPSYLQRVRTIPQVQHSLHDDLSVTRYPSRQQHAGSYVLRPNHELCLYAPVTTPAQNGGTVRSYSVSAKHFQSTVPGIAEHSTDITDYEQSTAPRSSRELSKKKDGPQVTEVQERVHLKKSRIHQSLQPESSARIRPSRGKNNAFQHDANVFDLALDENADWLGDDFIEQQSLQPQRDSEHRSSNAKAGSKRRKSDKGQRSKTLDHGPYQAFDLETLHQTPMHEHIEAFDLDAVLRQERISHDDRLTSSPEDKTKELGFDIDIKAPSDDNPYVAADMYTGWYNSNSLAALVPEEDGDLNEHMPESSVTVFNDFNRQDTTQSQPYYEHEEEADTTREEAEEALEDIETQAPTLDQEIETFAQGRRNMASSLEARSATVSQIDSAFQQQEPMPSSSKSEMVDLQTRSQDPRRARFETLLKVRKPADTTSELLNEAWSLFLSSDNQETLAPYMFRLLNQSPNDKHYSRALAAFNTVPRVRRTQAMYKAAVDIELKRHQHGSAMNLAFEAAIKGFDTLPDLFAYLVKNLLWNSVAEVLHRNKYARQDFAQFAPAAEFSATASRRMLSIPELMSGCNGIPDLHAKVLSLAEKVQSPDSVFTEHIGLLKMMLQRLAIQVVENQDSMATVTPQALVSILGLEDFLGQLALHDKALSTIFSLPSSSDKLDLAMMVYRNFRFKHPSETPNPRILKGLISLCEDADQPLVPLFDYLLEQFSKKPDPAAYHKVMTICARNGDAKAVAKYLESFVNDYGNPKRAALVNPMVYAHAVAGDVHNAREQLNLLPTKYNINPDTVSWNMLMLAHVRSDDDVSAFDIREEMRFKDIKFNHYTYGQLLAVCASHGDVEAALDVLVDARDDGIEITVPMIHTIVETYLRNDNSQAALRFAMTTLDSENKEAVTRLWNSFIRYFAFKGNLTDLMKIRDLMARYNVAPDGMTYAPIMTLLTSVQRTAEAMNLLRRMHTDEKLTATMFHFSIILNGFVAEGNRDMAAVVFNEMKQRFPEISGSAHAAMSYLQASRDVPGDSSGSELDSSQGLKILAELLKDISSVKGSLFSSTSSKVQKNRAATSMYFETIVRALIRSGFHESAAQLTKHIPGRSFVDPGLESDRLLPSKGMTLAQLDIAMERQDWAEFDRIFHRVFENSIKKNSAIPVARRGQTVEDEKPNKIAKAPSHAKYSLSSYFNRYMEAMARQFRQRSMVKFFRTNLSRSGFVFTGRNWNKYIQVLCRSRQSEHQLQAFRIFEKTMMRKTQSWQLLARGKLKKTTTSYLWQPYGQRNRPILQRQNTTRLVKRSEELQFHPERRIPTYVTAVHLSAALIQAHFRARRGLLLQFDLIRRFAPRTKRFLQFMPRLKDGVQGTILRQLDRAGDAKPRPRSERSIREMTDLTGVMGDRSPLNQIPNEFLGDIEEVIGRGNLVRSLLKDDEVSKGHLEQGRTDIELGEMLTGQISRAPVVLAGKGRLETVMEMKKRISEEEGQKLRIVERLRDDLRARQLTGDIHRSSLQIGAPLDPSEQQDTDATTQGNSTSTDLPLPVLGNVITSIERQNVRDDRTGKSMGEIPVQQQLERITKQREQRNEAREQSRQRQPRIPQLAVPYMNLRRLRRRLGLRQRAKAQQMLEEMKNQFSPRAYQKRVAATERLEAFEQARRRRQAVLAYERDLKAGKRLNPFPETEKGAAERKFKFGGAKVRFVPVLGRKSKNYLVRRGILNDRRQRRVQTVPSKGMNYITRYDRTAKWLEARYGPRRPNLYDAIGSEEQGESEELDENVDEPKGDVAGEKVYTPFSE